VLFSLEDISAREQALQARQQRALRPGPVRALAGLAVGGGLQRRQAPDRRGALQGITDFRVFTDVHPEFVERCMAEIRVVDVNRQTLTLFRAPDKATLLHRLPDIFRDEMRGPSPSSSSSSGRASSTSSARR
jgi:hypothetical protein